MIFLSFEGFNLFYFCQHNASVGYSLRHDPLWILYLQAFPEKEPVLDPTDTFPDTLLDLSFLKGFQFWKSDSFGPREHKFVAASLAWQQFNRISVSFASAQLLKDAYLRLLEYTVGYLERPETACYVMLGSDVEERLVFSNALLNELVTQMLDLIERNVDIRQQEFIAIRIVILITIENSKERLT